MSYPRKVMSISELVNEVGMSRELLKNWIHIRGFPCFRNKPNGKVYVQTDLLDAWLIKKGKMKKDVPTVESKTSNQTLI